MLSSILVGMHCSHDSSFLESYTLSPTNLEFRPHSMHESTGRSHQKLHSIFGHHFPTVSRRRKGGPASISLGIRKLRHRLRRSLCGAGTCRTTTTAAHQLPKAGELPLVWTYILELRRAAVGSLQKFGWYHRLKKESALNILLMAHRGSCMVLVPSTSLTSSISTNSDKTGILLLWND